MKRLRVYLINYFGFSKIETNASIVLVLIVILISITPRLYTQHFLQTTDTVEADSLALNAWIRQIENSKQTHKVVAKAITTGDKAVELFSFDPNVVDKKDLLRLGFQSHISDRIVKFRKAGGHFNLPKDLKKIYGIDTLHLAEMYKYMKFQKKTTRKDPLTKKVKEIKLEEVIRFDINKADTNDLQKIKGIGPYYARKVVDYRNRLGGFYKLQQLNEIYNLRQEAVDKLKDHLYLEAKPKQLLNINTDSVKLLAYHPYLSWGHAKAIVNFRKQHGKFDAIESILEIKIISDTLYQKISPYLSVEP